MKKALYIILTIVMIVIAGLMLTGCKSKGPATYGQDIQVPESQVDPSLPGELIEKRGQQTNITDMSDFLTRLSKIEDFKFTYLDTEKDEENRYFFNGRFMKIKLQSAMTHATGEKYDEVLMDRVSKQAFTHCSKETCEEDQELERVNYEDYYIPSPFETLTRVTDAEYAGEEMLGNDYAKIFKGLFDGEETTVWVQEYWGYPIKLETKSGRIIKYADMVVDNTRDAETQVPFNFTIKGEDKHWWTWEHFLGIGQYDKRPDANPNALPLQVRA